MKQYLTDFLAVGGAASITVGAALLNTALAFAVAGLFMIAGAWLIAAAKQPASTTRNN